MNETNMQNPELTEVELLHTSIPERTGNRAGSGLPSFISFGREICGDLSSSESREWLVTNGIGGYASGTIAGLLTRRYHGILIAALDPPLGRTLLVSKIEEQIEYDGRTYLLSS